MTYVTDTTSGSFLQDKVSGTHHREETLCVCVWCVGGGCVGGMCGVCVRGCVCVCVWYVWRGCERVIVKVYLTELHAHTHTVNKNIIG